MVMVKIYLYYILDYYIFEFHLDLKNNQAEVIRLKRNNRVLLHSRSQRRIRRQSVDQTQDLDTASTVLSILPLDRIGTLVGQIMSTGLKEMFNPDVGKKIINVLENQGPYLLTSLFSNLFTTLSVPGKVPPKTNPTTSSVLNNNNIVKQLSNISTSDIMDAIRRPAKK